MCSVLNFHHIIPSAPSSVTSVNFWAQLEFILFLFCVKMISIAPVLPKEILKMNHGMWKCCSKCFKFQNKCYWHTVNKTESACEFCMGRLYSLW